MSPPFPPLISRTPDRTVGVFFDVTLFFPPVGVCCVLFVFPFRRGVSGLLRMNSMAFPDLPHFYDAGMEVRSCHGFIVANTPDSVPVPVSLLPTSKHFISSALRRREKHGPCPESGLPPRHPAPPRFCFCSVPVCCFCLLFCWLFCSAFFTKAEANFFGETVQKRRSGYELSKGKTGFRRNRLFGKLLSFRDSDPEDFRLLALRLIAYDKDVQELQRKQRQIDSDFSGPVLRLGRRFRPSFRHGGRRGFGRVDGPVRKPFQSRSDRPDHLPDRRVTPLRVFDGLWLHIGIKKENFRRKKRVYPSSYCSARYSSYSSLRNCFWRSLTASSSLMSDSRYSANTSSGSPRSNSSPKYRSSLFAISPSNVWGSSSMTRRRNDSGVKAIEMKKRKSTARPRFPAWNIKRCSHRKRTEKPRGSNRQKPGRKHARVFLNRPLIIVCRTHSFNGCGLFVWMTKRCPVLTQHPKGVPS